MELTKDNLNKRALQTRVSQAKAYYERMHISPLMVNEYKLINIIIFNLDPFEFFTRSFQRRQK